MDRHAQDVVPDWQMVSAAVALYQKKARGDNNIARSRKFEMARIHPTLKLFQNTIDGSSLDIVLWSWLVSVEVEECA